MQIHLFYLYLKNQTFQVVLEQLAKLEKTSAENLVLLLQDRTLKFYDTPLSVNLTVTDILGKHLNKKEDLVIFFIHNLVLNVFYLRFPQNNTGHSRAHSSYRGRQ